MLPTQQLPPIVSNCPGSTNTFSIAAAVVTLVFGGSAMAQEKTLRLLTWADYAPAAVVAQFEKETGYKVELTLSNNEEMISKLRATAAEISIALGCPRSQATQAIPR